VRAEEHFRRSPDSSPLSAAGTQAATYCFASVVAESAACCVRVPAEQLKMRLQTRAEYTMVDAFTAVWRAGGVGSLYKGLGATLLLDIAFCMLQFPVFEGVRHLIARRRADAAGPGAGGGSLAATAADGCVAGAIAGGFAAFLTTPLDVLRTKHVLAAQARRADGSPAPRASVFHTAGLIWREEGASGLMRGVLPRTLYMSLGGVAYLGSYTWLNARLTEVQTSGGFRM